MPEIQMRKLSPVLIVDEIEPCLSFWTDRLGFARLAEVPEGNALGFVRGLDPIVPRRQTFYGSDEIGVVEPGGHVVMFAQPTTSVAAG